MKLHLDKEDWKYIPDMLSECYLINDNGIGEIVVKPLPGSDITMKFSSVNGSLCGTVIDWEKVKVRGVLL